jgi:hypothetical protein
MTLIALSKDTLAGQHGEAIAPDSAIRFNGLVLSIERTPQSNAQEMAEDDRKWPGRIRRIVHAKLRHWDLAYLYDSVALLVTELVTNALRYGAGTVIVFRCSYSCSAGVVRIEVDDGSHRSPYIRESGPQDESGRGLILVSAIADEWGTSEDGSRTWCTLAAPGGGH